MSMPSVVSGVDLSGIEFQLNGMPKISGTPKRAVGTSASGSFSTVLNLSGSGNLISAVASSDGTSDSQGVLDIRITIDGGTAMVFTDLLYNYQNFTPNPKNSTTLPFGSVRFDTSLLLEIQRSAGSGGAGSVQFFYLED